MADPDDQEKTLTHRQNTDGDAPGWQQAIEADGWAGQVLPGVAAVIFIIIVALAVMAGESALRSSTARTNETTLQAVLDNTQQRFNEWAVDQENHARAGATDTAVRQALVELNQSPVRADLLQSPWQDEILERFQPTLEAFGYLDYQLISPNGTILASTDRALLGQPTDVLEPRIVETVARRGAVISRPEMIDPTASHQSPMEHATMQSIAQAIADDGTLLGYFLLNLDPRGEYAATFQVGRTGMTGDTYVVDDEGWLLSQSRYEEDLVRIGLLPEGMTSVLRIMIRDPGVDLTIGGRPVAPPADWPLTYAAAEVSSGRSGNNLQGYRDARGVLVIGAWEWDEERQFGIITEVSVSEALAGAYYARAILRVFAVAMALSFILLAVIFSAARNISRQRAQATNEAKQRFSQILMTAAEGIYGIDGEGRVTFVNPRACDMLGYTEDELIGRPMHETVHHSHRDGSLYPIEECPIHGDAVSQEGHNEETFWTKDGQPIPIEYARSFLNPDQPTAGSVVTFRDITKRKRDELAMRRYAQELKRSNAELQEFAYAASHDLQEPLRKIQAFGERLNSKYSSALDDNGRHYLERMVDAAGRMRQLIDDLLSYSRVNSKTTAFLPVELSAVVADVLSDLEPRIAMENATVRVGELPAIEADPGQMHQVFLNLVANALKFRKSGVDPVVTIEGQVEVGETGAVARISVADNGIGFEPRHAERIFGMFERLHGREEYDGTGVGLATCRKIAERHSGELTAWGEPDAGAVFTLTLPIRQTAST